MADNLSWTFQLVDKVSQPAKNAEKATSDFEKELKKVHAEIDRIKLNPGQFKELQHAKKDLAELRGSTKSWAEKFDEVGQGVKQIGFVQNTMLAAEAFKLAYEFGEKVVDVAFDIGRDMLKAAGEAERFKVSFSSLLGEEGGKDVIEYIEHIEKATEASQGELKSLSAHLLTVGFDAKELQQILPASLDIAGFLGGGVEKAQAAAEALAHIKTTGEISKRSIGTLGLQYAAVMDQLKKETGLGDEAVKKRLESGKFGPQVLHAVLQSIANKEGGQLGTTAEKMAATIDSKLKKLKELPDKFFEGLVNSEGFSKFEAFVSKLVDELSPDSEFGREAAAGLEGLFNDIFGGIAGRGEDATAVIKEGILAGIDAARDLVPVVKEIAGDLLDVIEYVSEGIRGIRLLRAAQTGDVNTVAQILQSEVDRQWSKKNRADEKQMRKEGREYGDRGVLAPVGGGSVLADENRAQLGPLVNDPGRPVAGVPAIPSQASRVQPGTGGGRVDNRATIHLEINAPNGNADEIADQVRSTLPGAMQQGFDKMATVSGAL